MPTSEVFAIECKFDIGNSRCHRSVSVDVDLDVRSVGLFDLELSGPESCNGLTILFSREKLLIAKCYRLKLKNLHPCHLRTANARGEDKEHKKQCTNEIAERGIAIA